MRASFAAYALPQLSPGLREQPALQRHQLLELWKSGDLSFKIVGVTSVAPSAVLLWSQEHAKTLLALAYSSSDKRPAVLSLRQGYTFPPLI